MGKRLEMCRVGGKSTLGRLRHGWEENKNVTLRNGRELHKLD
jgi:hypothetical protein